MKYTRTEVDGVVIVDIEPHRDERGFFCRSFDAAEFAAHGLDTAVAQTTIFATRARGTLRGLHRQVPPYAQATLVRCTRGAIVLVAVDVRPTAPTYRRHAMVYLAAHNHRALFLAAYIAHGFQTLIDDTEVILQVSRPHVPGAKQGFRWDDPDFGIDWPLDVSTISDQDAHWPWFAEAGSMSR
jgi:dTDP-4-dehydrorhamnose 3,5-epimerase